MTPRATYRLQFHEAFTFADAEALVPYLSDLGISHLYASPITTAVRGSRHGYDVTDPTRINPELGGDAGFRSLVAALQARGLGCIIDIVPNHMGVAGDQNLWWLNVLEQGRGSRYASVFDIDWSRPIALPVLGAPLRDVLRAGDIRLVERGETLGIQLYGTVTYPIRGDDPILAEPRTSVIARHQDNSALADLLGRQHYQLLYWRAANDSLNWRRFFSINDLAGVRVEDPGVFALTHSLYFDLFREGLIDGVRVDHIDGLADPASYCKHLRARLIAAAPHREPYIVVEKILAAGERLSPSWGTNGTSGYDFMREVSELLHEPAGQAPLAALWETSTGRTADFEVEARLARREMLAWQFEGQLQGCIEAFRTLARSVGEDWVTFGMIRRAVACLLEVFPVYRTYGTGTDAPLQDGAVRAKVREAAVALAPPGEMHVVDLILSWLGGNAAGATEPAIRAVRRFQQLSAPIAAKGVEDTAFYRHGVLLSANDVGFDPSRMGRSIYEFHLAMQARARDQPHALLATATHDHKRGEDGRARLAVLSAIPDIWRTTILRWRDLARPYAAGVDAADLYMLFQALVGAWEEAPGTILIDRIQAWQRKALREARLRSSWEAPDENYEARCADMSAAFLTSPFREDFEAFMTALRPAGLANSVAQTALHYLTPGVPDLYQGCELADHSMVDPDNRQPVDFNIRRDLAAGTASDPKFKLIADLLALRKSGRALTHGTYVPLPVTGPHADKVVAFTRSDGNDILCCAIAIRLGGILFGKSEPHIAAGWWENCEVGDGEMRRPVDKLFAENLVAIWRP